MSVDIEQVLQVIRARRSVRRFLPDPVPAAHSGELPVETSRGEADAPASVAAALMVVRIDEVKRFSYAIGTKCITLSDDALLFVFIQIDDARLEASRQDFLDIITRDTRWVE
jgi:hypothetical protein